MSSGGAGRGVLWGEVELHQNRQDVSTLEHGTRGPHRGAEVALRSPSAHAVRQQVHVMVLTKSWAGHNCVTGVLDSQAQQHCTVLASKK